MRARGVFAAFGWAVALAVFLLPVVSPDIFWHLSAGRFMVAARTWPRADWLSFTMQGRPWVDFEWLCQLIWFGALHFGGWWALVALKAAVFVAAGLCLWRLLDLYDVGAEGKTLSLVAWAVAWIPLNDLRPENFSVLLFTVQLWFLEARRLGRKPPIPAWSLPILYVVWANLHAGFFYGLVLFAIYVAVDLLRHGGAASRHPGESRGPGGNWLSRLRLAPERRDFGLLLASAAATLVNPYGWGLHGVLWEHARDMATLQTYITEWQQPYLFNAWLIPFWLLMLATMTVVFSRWLQDRDVPAEHWLLLAFFSYSAAAHARLVVYLVLVAVPISAAHLGHLYWTRKRSVREPATVLATLAFAAFFLERMGPTLALRVPFIPKYIPFETIQFVEANRETLRGHRMFNPWQWGGYLGYRLYPDLKVFVDGRYLFHPLIEPMLRAKDSPEAYREFLDRFGVDLVLMRAEKQMFELPVSLGHGKTATVSRPFFVAFLPEKDWAMVYWSREGFIFARRKNFPAGWIDANEYRLLRPDDFAAIELLIKSGAASKSTLAADYRRLARWAPSIAHEPWYENWVRNLSS